MKTTSLLYLLSFFILTSITNCSNKTIEMHNRSNDSIKFLALGDSYTIGESVATDKRWPVQLANRLNEDGFEVKEPKIIATTGWTTAELLEGIEKDNPIENYDLVSLLIGVNNQYRGYEIDIYKTEFRILIEQAIKFAGNKSENVFVVSIPNYGVTPFGQTRGEEKIRTELLEYDRIAKEIANDYGINFVDITPISEKAKSDLELVADDNLHPSGKMYSEWTDKIYPVDKSILEK